MENAGLSFSWDSESQQKHFHVISLGRQDAIEKGQKPERAGFKSQLPPFIICVTRTNLASQARFSRTSQGSVTTWQAAAQTECESPWRREAPGGALKWPLRSRYVLPSPRGQWGQKMPGRPEAPALLPPTPGQEASHSGFFISEGPNCTLIAGLL